MNIIEYDREAAVAYARKWALGRNPEYYSFHDIGGDCTNFISQCVYAGCGVMNFTPVVGWYYIDANERTASWTSVKYFHNFIVNNEGPGPFGEDVSRDRIQPGDVIQLGRANGEFYHSLLVMGITRNEIYIAAHNNDALYRPLSSYNYQRIRYIHIIAARSEE
ncbi:MAG: amidase domain-containing protein [Oscillospiraceae bacterium]